MMRKSIRVLLVEDNPGDAELIRELLEANVRLIEIELAVDGQQAIDRLLRREPYAQAKRPDVVVLDLNLPRMDGRQVLVEMRARPELQMTPVIVLTSSDAEKDVIESYRLGANCYLTKPGDLSAFQAIVKSICDFWFTAVKLP